MAEKDRSNELIEIIGTDAEEELVEEAVLPAPAEEVEELLQAAAARHKASDTDVTTAPFLAI
jgi:hypothetical protein